MRKHLKCMVLQQSSKSWSWGSKYCRTEPERGLPKWWHGCRLLRSGSWNQDCVGSWLGQGLGRQDWWEFEKQGSPGRAASRNPSDRGLCSCAQWQGTRMFTPSLPEMLRDWRQSKYPLLWSCLINYDSSGIWKLKQLFKKRQMQDLCDCRGKISNIWLGGKKQDEKMGIEYFHLCEKKLRTIHRCVCIFIDYFWKVSKETSNSPCIWVRLWELGGLTFSFLPCWLLVFL